jgi:8-oxo-dGTP pyrophosphatase MutT (NUDIX family)
VTAASTHSFTVVPAAYVYLRRGDDVLLQLRQNTGFMDGRWAAAAAGHIELGETAATAVRREAHEELGIGLDENDLAALTVMQRTDGTATPREQRVDFFFTASHWRGTPRRGEPDKCAALDWFPMTALPEAMPPHERFVLTEWAGGRMPQLMAFGF